MKNKWLLPAGRGVALLWFLSVSGYCTLTQRLDWATASILELVSRSIM